MPPVKAPVADAPASPALSALSKASYALFLEAAAGTGGKGCFLSPMSIIYALTLALNGAGPKTSTHSELLAAIAGGAENAANLGEGDLNSELGRTMTLLNGAGAGAAEGSASRMVLANSVWTHRGTTLRKEYVDAMQSLFDATAREAVNGAKDVNAWVEGVTKGMIKDLVQTDQWDAILANAIYFKGFWTHAFKKEDTFPGEFTTGAKATKEVPFMCKNFEAQDRITAVRKEGLYDAVALPYKGDAFSAIALLPAVGVAMEAALKDWGSGPQELRPVGKCFVKLPKFKVESQLSLKTVLHKLGVKQAFGGSADFSRLSDTKMFVSDVVHKAVVEVDEEGTVAAAATAVMMLRCALPMPTPEFIFNRPFAFIIMHTPTGLPAFVGTVNDPSQ
eukprot:XP_001695981.1 flagellar associated protein, protease inhibitor-like protein [Chlamydomonas reinhardtii]